MADAELVLSWVHPSSLAETDMGIQEKGLVTCPIGCQGRVPSEALCPYSVVIVQFWLLFWDSHLGEKDRLVFRSFLPDSR